MTSDLFSQFAPVNGMPVTIVFGTFNYRNTLHKWIEYAASCCDHWRIICLDKELFDWLHEIGHSTEAVYFYDLFPDAPKYNFLINSGKNLAKVCGMRIKFFRALAEGGYDFIHSDADAFWLKDPRPWLMQHSEFDLLFSQGTYHPREYFSYHRFTLCSGFFFCRANTRTQDCFQRVEKIRIDLGDTGGDQTPINQVIFQDLKILRKIPQLTTMWSGMGDWKKNWKIGKWRKLPALVSHVVKLRRYAPLWLRQVEWKLLHCWFNYIFTSPDIISGKCSNGLSVGVIPMHLVTRIGKVSSASPMVLHIRGNQKHGNKK